MPVEATASVQPRFLAAMTVGDALRLDPRVRWVLVAYHVGHCSTCPVSEEETLEQVAKGYGFPLEKLLGDLNSLTG